MVNMKRRLLEKTTKFVVDEYQQAPLFRMTEKILLRSLGPR